MKDDSISRDGVISTVKKVRDVCDTESLDDYRDLLVECFKVLPSVQHIRCRDCRWWDKIDDDGVYGYCRAENYFHRSKNWEIDICRKYKNDFYCADAERREG